MKRSTQATSHSKGRAAESLACAYLARLGWQIVAQNYKTVFGEIDILASDPQKKLLIACEVKFRKHPIDALYSISRHQQLRIAQTLEYFLSLNESYQQSDVRFDAIFVKNLPSSQTLTYPDDSASIYHISNAWSL